MTVNGNVPFGLHSELSSESQVDTLLIIMSTEAIAESRRHHRNERPAVSYSRNKQLSKCHTDSI